MEGRTFYFRVRVSLVVVHAQAIPRFHVCERVNEHAVPVILRNIKHNTCIILLFENATVRNQVSSVRKLFHAIAGIVTTM